MIDVAIIGGGPAGSAAARLLASWGHRVAIFDKQAGGASLAESIPPSTRKLLDVFRISHAIDEGGFLPWRGNVVCWGNERRVEWFPDGVAGHHVVRREFDRLLRVLAVNQGAIVCEGTVTGASLAEGGDRVRVLLESTASRRPDPGARVPEPETRGPNSDPQRPGPGARSPEPEALSSEAGARAPAPDLDARFVLDCSGRAGVLARSFRLRMLEEGRRTIALAGVWSRPDGWADLDSSCTFIETYHDGWLWSVPVADGRRYVTVMIDPRATDLERGGGAERAYLHEIAKAAQFMRFIRDARLDAGPWGFDATQYTASRFHGPGFLLVGDAGSALDPLSSFGVKKALASAWLASIAVHTALERPAMRDRAFAFFDARERDVYASSRRASREFAASAAIAHGHPFWINRGFAAVDVIDGEDPVERLREDPEVLRAFATIREAPALRLRRSPRVSIESRPGVAGREIVMQDCLVSDWFPEGVRHLRGVDLPHLIDFAPLYADAGELFSAYNRSRAPIALPDFLGALAVLLASGALEWNRIPS